jgi:hypothetical protein
VKGETLSRPHDQWYPKQFWLQQIRRPSLRLRGGVWYSGSDTDSEEDEDDDENDRADFISQQSSEEEEQPDRRELTWDEVKNDGQGVVLPLRSLNFGRFRDIFERRYP